MTKVLENIWSWWSENVKKCVIWVIREAYVCKSSKMLFLGYWVDEECERVQSGGSGGDGHPQGPTRWAESLEEPCCGLRGHRGNPPPEYKTQNTRKPNTISTKASFSIVKSSQQGRPASWY